MKRTVAARSTRTPQTRRIAMVAFDGVLSLDVTGPLEVFASASDHVLRDQANGAPAYQVEILAAKAGAVRTASGIRLVAERPYGAVRGNIDTLLVPGGEVRAAVLDPALRRWLRRIAPRVRRLGSVCTGAFILGEAGLLDGKRATTHWAAIDLFRSRYPGITVEPDAIFVRDGSTYTSAGVTAGMDMALALVEEDLGHQIALAVARRMVMFLKRPGGQSQFSSHLAAQALPTGPLKDLPEWILTHLDADLSVEALAARAAMSPRNFARVFTRETGMTPAKFVERARIDHARRALEDTRQPVESVAWACGFGNAERMRRTFQRHLQVVPQDYRRRFPNARAPRAERRV